jgi:hypothetical protein
MGCAASAPVVAQVDRGRADLREKGSSDRQESAPSSSRKSNSWSSQSSACSSASSGRDAGSVSTSGSAGPQGVPNEMELAISRVKQLKRNPMLVSPINKTLSLKRNIPVASSSSEQLYRKNGARNDDSYSDDDDEEQVPTEDEIRQAEEVLRLAAKYFDSQIENDQESDENDDGWATGSSESDIRSISSSSSGDCDDRVNVVHKSDEHHSQNEPRPPVTQHADVDLEYYYATKSPKNPNEPPVVSWEFEEGKKVWIDPKSPAPSKRRLSDYYRGPDPRGPNSPFLFLNKQTAEHPDERFGGQRLIQHHNEVISDDAHDITVQPLASVHEMVLLEEGGVPVDAHQSDEENDAQHKWLFDSLSKKKRRKRIGGLDCSLSPSSAYNSPSSSVLSSPMSSMSSNYDLDANDHRENPNLYNGSTVSDAEEGGTLLPRNLLADISKRHHHDLHKPHDDVSLDAKRLKKAKNDNKAAKKSKQDTKKD